YDPRDFAMVAMGGAGPLHAVEIARELAIPSVVVPNLPSHFSALGMLMADMRHDYVRTYYRRLDQTDFAELAALYDELVANGRGVLDRSGVAAADMRFQWTMDLRYLGQEFSLQVPVDEAEVRRGDHAAILHRFNETHDRHFGHAATDEPLELVNIRLAAEGMRPKIEFPKLSEGTAEARIGSRPVYLDDPRKPVDCAVFRRERLGPGARLAGPCVVEEYGSTTVLFADDRLTVTETGEMLIEVAQP
ncbi:MAG TPA: hydantoinase/oxoprolinase family protein, partial [Hyphomicrobiales bacterium]|nr:hydantoinase/oxoprolinase family protein [Hyphomicrobiales bacterium]